MEESVRSGGRLEVSVSFGRFEKDELSWDKWSTFSPNKYLEEAGNLSTPGSVAQKKAYFEAHYKKIAARKAEELELEKSIEPIATSRDISRTGDFVESSLQIDYNFGLSNGGRLSEEVAEAVSETVVTNGAIFSEEVQSMEPITPTRDSSRTGDSVENSVEIDNKFGLTNGGRLIEEAAEAVPETRATNGAVFYGEEDDSAESPKEEGHGGVMTEPIEEIASEEKKASDIVVVVNCASENSTIDEPKYEMNGKTEEPPLDERKEAKNAMKGSKNGIRQSIASKRGDSKVKSPNVVQKGNGTPSKKDVTLTATKKKVVSPSIKPSPASTPRYPKPSSVNTPTTLKKQVNGSPLLKSKNYSSGESKRTAPTSMHMSRSLNAANSLAAISMTRKSLIMEKMGDKDIVKRAFKTFQRGDNGSTSDEKPSPVKPMSPIAFDPKISNPRIPTKVDERPTNDSEKRTARRSQSGTKLNPPVKGPAPDRKKTAVSSPATGTSSEEKAQKRKEFLKKLEAKSIARGAEKARLSAKSEQARSENEIHHN